MSTASTIPETWELTGDDARRTLQQVGRGQLVKDAFKRLRWSDGFSHGRSVAFLLSLLFIEGVIALVGLASVMQSGGLSDAIVRALKTAAPGPAGSVLTEAVGQAHRAGSNSRYLALWLGLAAALITGTTLLGQFERGMNRIYGIEKDRPTVRKYVRAFLLLCTAGVLAAVGFACVALGHVIGTSFNNDTWASVWNVARWPVGLAFMVGAIALIFSRSPRRHQPSWSWLAFGAVLAAVLWVAVTLALDVFFRVSHTFGQTYGPLAGIVALLLWSYASAIAVLFGVSVSAQLEAVRAGVAAPQDMSKETAAPPRRDVAAASAPPAR